MSIVDESYEINKQYFNNESYVEWLESFTIDETINDEDRLSYKNLIRALWSIDYIPTIGNDDDRAAEGLQLRTRYNDILARKAGKGNFYTPNVCEIFGECRVLEMLVALSMRMYDLMQDMGLYNSVSRWFWEIMEAVGFDILDDEYWTSGDIDADDYVWETCEHIMNHDGTYSNGHRGGWFWIVGWEKMEVWYQMHTFLKSYF